MVKPPGKPPGLLMRVAVYPLMLLSLAAVILVVALVLGYCVMNVEPHCVSSLVNECADVP